MVRKSKGLSERHHKILEFVSRYQNRGYPPSIREIGEATGVTSTSVVNYYLDQLEKWGFVERDRHISRGVRVIPERLAEIGAALTAPAQSALKTVEELFRVPLAGRIGASLPMPVPASDFSYYGAEESVEIARSLLPSRTSEGLFALEVSGDSMIDAMVNDGDIVIMKAVSNNAEAKDGDMVAVWLPARDETTLKYFYKEKSRYRLQPANPTMGPIYISKEEPLEIRGKVVMVVRKIGAKTL